MVRGRAYKVEEEEQEERGSKRAEVNHTDHISIVLAQDPNLSTEFNKCFHPLPFTLSLTLTHTLSLALSYTHFLSPLYSIFPYIYVYLSIYKRILFLPISFPLSHFQFNLFIFLLICFFSPVNYYLF